jgi:hypothetical protein
MRDRHWYTRFGIEEPFPWLGIAIGALVGLLAVPSLSWIAFELIDQDFETRHAR